MLQDLAPLKTQAESSVASNLSLELKFDEETKLQLLAAYQRAFPSYPAVIQDNLIKITNSNNQTAYLPFNWFARIKHCRDLIGALKQYGVYANHLKGIIGDQAARFLPMVGWESHLAGDTISQIESFIDATFTDIADRQRFREFLTGDVWLDRKSADSELLSGKKLNRQPKDFIASCITTICRLINDTAGKLEQFISIYIDDESVRDLIDSLEVSPSVTSSGPSSLATDRGFVSSGHNKIFYGAPGTGKSYSISQGRDEEYLIRTVFHPDTQYSDFVGCLKPMMQDGNVGYQFRPGPFTEALIKAINNPTHSYSLVIEEINRAAAAAVFGEIFQLLDRDEDGSSTYSIHVSDPDLLDYLNVSTSGYFSEGTLKIPSNLSLLATMNSSDQAVMPMDTAFKRRWQFEYLRIDYNKASSGQLTFNVSSIDRPVSKTVRWADFARVINERLASERIPEDRLLGHRFISENELVGDTSNVLKGKLFMYLWDDVLRHGQHRVIFRDIVNINDQAVELANFGQLIEAFEQGAAVFNDVIEQQLSELSEASSVAEIADSNDDL